MKQEVAHFGKQSFAACVLTHRFLSTFAARIEAATEFADSALELDKMRLATLRGYYSRTMGWMNSIVRLNRPDDVQAVSVAARAMFEALVDLVLLHHVPQEQPFEKLFDWERSATLNHAESVMAFFKGKPTGEYQGFSVFLGGPEIAVIKAARRRWYGSSKHPGGRRWTGNHLGEDANRADELLAKVKLRSSVGTLYEFHELEHALLCWATHGSGLAGLRSIDVNLVPAQCATRLNRIHDFALCIVQLVLQELGLFLQVEFDDFIREAQKQIAAIQTGDPSEQ